MSFRAKRIWAEGTSPEEEVLLASKNLHAKGRFAYVFSSMMEKPLRKKVAVKQAIESKVAEQQGLQYKGEADVLAQLNHPHVVRLLYYYVESINNEKLHWMILDFLPYDMGSLKERGIQLDAIDAAMYAWQLWSALEYVNEKGYAHLDVKPQNLIFDHNTGLLQLADFGNAKKLVSGEKNLPYQVTRFYRAPELLFGSEELNFGIDWWAAACVTAEFATRRTLLREGSANAQMRLIVHTFGYPTRDEIKEMKIARPRVAAPSRTRGIEGLLDPPHQTDLLDLLKKCLVYSPSRRLTPPAAMKHPYFAKLFTDPPPKRSNGLPIPDFISNDTETNEGSEKK